MTMVSAYWWWSTLTDILIHQASRACHGSGHGIPSVAPFDTCIVANQVHYITKSCNHCKTREGLQEWNAVHLSLTALVNTVSLCDVHAPTHYNLHLPSIQHICIASPTHQQGPHTLLKLYTPDTWTTQNYKNRDSNWGWNRWSGLAWRNITHKL